MVLVALAIGCTDDVGDQRTLIANQPVDVTVDEADGADGPEDSPTGDAWGDEARDAVATMAALDAFAADTPIVDRPLQERPGTDAGVEIFVEVGVDVHIVDVARDVLINSSTEVLRDAMVDTAVDVFVDRTIDASRDAVAEVASDVPMALRRDVMSEPNSDVARGCGATGPCTSGRACCGDQCVDTQSTVNHCGACGMACRPQPRAVVRCDRARCAYSCIDGFKDCNGLVEDGCETDITSSIAHCGACDGSCAARSGTVARCEGARCVYTCVAGRADCDGDASNGCEVELAASASHCGRCGNVCASPFACVEGECGCSGRSGSPDSLASASLSSAGRVRSYYAYLPRSYRPTRPMPLVIGLHGITGHGAEQAAFVDTPRYANAYGYIGVHPDGVSQSWNAGECCGPARLAGVDDIAFLRDLIATAQSRWCVDPRRIYLVGFSNGGMMAHRVACELADQLTAFGTISGTRAVSSCSPSRSLPTIHVHGTSDSVVPYNGSFFVGNRSVDETLNTWRSRNACASSEVRTLDQGNVHCTRRRECGSGAHVELCRIDGGGHEWPRFPFNATTHVLDFLWTFSR
jgi:polyhydroxybutyrate depolymerase